MAIYQATDLIGKLVRVNRGGPESSEGLVIAVRSDYLVLFVKKEGTVYYNLEHIKSITIVRHIDRFDRHGHHHNAHCKFKKHSTFLEALRSKKNRTVKINRGGPESVTGVLVAAHKDYIKLLVEDELVIIFTAHIKSFSSSFRIVNRLAIDHKENKNVKNRKGKS